VRARAAAFFDVDGTLIRTKSMFAFQAFWYRAHGAAGAREERAFLAEMRALERGGAERETINRTYYRWFAGRAVAEVAQAGEDWFAALEPELEGLLIGPAVACLRGHARGGVEPVFVSGSFPAALRPLARHLGVETILATTLLAEGGRYTGAIGDPQTIGAGKARAAAAFAARTGVELAQSHAYGDDRSDLPLLALVGHPHAVGGDPALEAAARVRGWPVLDPALAGGAAEPSQTVRSTAG
jgi:HAD superfamily hydrolase (TIGR01490 family)